MINKNNIDLFHIIKKMSDNNNFNLFHIIKKIKE